MFAPLLLGVVYVEIQFRSASCLNIGNSYRVHLSIVFNVSEQHAILGKGQTAEG
jgi:hypothetical protein